MSNVLFPVLMLSFCVALPLWHRGLMRYLQSRHPEVWKRLGDGWSSGLWRNSVDYPFWSWRSLLFLLTARYTKLGDPSFSRRATAFVVAFFVWLGLIVGPTAIHVVQGSPWAR